MSNRYNLELANKKRAEMSLEELAKMKAADEAFKKNQELKVEKQRKALQKVTKDNIEMVSSFNNFKFINNNLDK